MFQFFQIFKMDLLNNFKNPVLIGYNTIFSVLMVLIMGFLTGGNYSNSINAYNYYAISIMVFIMLEGAMTATNCFMERDIKKANLRILYSPCGKFPVYFSKITASFVFDYLLHVALIVAFLPTGVNFGGIRIGWILLMMAPVEFAATSLGVFFCCIFKCEENASTILSLLVSTLSFLGGSFFSLDGMGSTLAAASRISPVKWLIDTFFSVIYDGNLSTVAPVILSCLIISMLLIFGCAKTFRTEDYL